MRPWRIQSYNARSRCRCCPHARAPQRARHRPPYVGAVSTAGPAPKGRKPPSQSRGAPQQAWRKKVCNGEALGWRQIGLWRARGTPSGCERQPRRPRWFGGTSRVSSRASFARVGRASRLGVPIAHFFSLRSAERGLQRARGTTLGFERPQRRPTRVGDTVRMSPSASLARAGRASRRGEAMHTFFCIATFLLDCTKFFVQLHEIFRAIAAFRCRVLLHTFFSAARFFFGCNIFVSAARNRVSLHTFGIRLGTPRGPGLYFTEKANTFSTYK